MDTPTDPRMPMDVKRRAIAAGATTACYHCGASCDPGLIRIGDKIFCCSGCKMVFQLLNQSGLCDYYALNEQPGLTQQKPKRSDKFAFLEDSAIAEKLISFRNEEQAHVSFYLPQMHCSSCLYLLENLHKLNEGIFSCRVDFIAKSVVIVFDPRRLSLRGIADLLTSVGYEPYISLHDLKGAKPAVSRAGIYRLGVAGFCFANIMLISFPEYLGLDMSERSLQLFFRRLDLFLSLPVLFYSAQPFYLSAWKGLRGRFLNIDAPIVLAILVTFGRSLYEVVSGTGAGYFDSMTGIVFFMLMGRILQDKTYRQLSFERDYTSYFPIAVTAMREGQQISKMLPDIQAGDQLLIHHEELIPADGIVTLGQALIDYSFVTGESLPVLKEIGDLVYAGGRQTGASIEVLVVKEVAQSYLTGLWNRQDERADAVAQKGTSFVHFFSRWFTVIVFAVAGAAALYWWKVDPLKIWNAVTAVLIVACPCALLLSSSFTNGNILRILGRNKCYLRNAQTIENISATTHIVFDKTGTLTEAHEQEIVFEGGEADGALLAGVAGLAVQSRHPLSRALARMLDRSYQCTINAFREVAGQGVEGWIDGHLIALGTRAFVTGEEGRGDKAGTRVYVARDGVLQGWFGFSNHYRAGLAALVNRLSTRYRISVLSGDNPQEQLRLRDMMGAGVSMLFDQSPADKAAYIERLQRRGEKVMMVGDGLNDAGALRQSDTGVALSEDCNNFTPASDVILDAAQLSGLPGFIRLCQAERKIILASFIMSILYNLIGLYFSVQGILSPMIAAILMPASSLSILLLTYGASGLAARRLSLQ